MSKITPQSFSRNAENQLAATLEQKVERFRKSKVKRLDQAREISRWAYMLFDLVNKLSIEPAMPSPVPPLVPLGERALEYKGALTGRSLAPTLTTDQMLVDLNHCESPDAEFCYLEARTDQELRQLSCAAVSERQLALIGQKLRSKE